MKNDGSGTIYRRGEIYWVKIYTNGKPLYFSSKSDPEVTWQSTGSKKDAIKLRDKLIGQRHRGELGPTPARWQWANCLTISCGIRKERSGLARSTSGA